jgi:hypothetical protein
LGLKMSATFGRRRRPRTTRCKRCKTKIKVKNKGPVPKYCGQACKQEAYLRRRFRSPVELVARDLASIEVREVIRATIMDMVQQGSVKSNLPPPIMHKPKPKKPNLRLVKNDDDPAGSNGPG